MPELRLRGGEVDGLDLHYLVEGRGPAVVLVHGLGGFAESWRHTLRGLARCVHRPVREEVDFFVDFGFAARTAAEARAAYLATLRHVRTDFEVHAEDYRRAIATLDLPVLLIHGRQDRVVPSAHCALVAEGFAHATVRWVDECGHFPQIEQAETVNRWLVDFLVGRPAPR